MLTGKSQKPDVAMAWRLADSIVALSPPGPYARLNSDLLVAMVIARASKDAPALADSARHVIKRSEGDATVDKTRDLAWFGAMAYTMLGDKSDAVRLLKAYLAVNPQKAGGLRDDPGWAFRELSSDTGFRQLVGGR